MAPKRRARDEFVELPGYKFFCDKCNKVYHTTQHLSFHLGTDRHAENLARVARLDGGGLYPIPHVSPVKQFSIFNSPVKPAVPKDTCPTSPLAFLDHGARSQSPPPASIADQALVTTPEAGEPVRGCPLPATGLLRTLRERTHVPDTELIEELPMPESPRTDEPEEITFGLAVRTVFSRVSPYPKPFFAGNLVLCIHMCDGCAELRGHACLCTD